MFYNSAVTFGDYRLLLQHIIQAVGFAFKQAGLRGFVVVHLIFLIRYCNFNFLKPHTACYLRAAKAWVFEKVG